MKGIRLTVLPAEEGFLSRIAATPGAYGTRDGVTWFCTTPNGLLGSLGHHAVTCHEDGTITVSPSILVTGAEVCGGPKTWHGYLERGVWREC